MVESSGDKFLLVESIPIHRSQLYGAIVRIDDAMTVRVQRRPDILLCSRGKTEKEWQGDQRQLPANIFSRQFHRASPYGKKPTLCQSSAVLNIFPLDITNSTLRMSWIFSRGFPLIKIKSARFPASIVPSSFSIPIARAGTIVAA